VYVCVISSIIHDNIHGLR